MLQISFLLASLSGYFLFLYILLRGKMTALYPALLVSGITASSFIAGLLGCLQHMYSFIYVTGFVLLPLCICHIVKNGSTVPPLRLKDIFPFVVLVAGSVLLYFSLKDRFIYGTDDYSHWARVIRSITEHLRLPIEADEYSHGSYPPGSGLFIAYVATVVENSEGIWLFAHGLMILSFLTALLTASRNVVVQAILSCFIGLMMNYVNPLETLLVDTLLGASALSCAIFCMLDEECSECGNIILSLLLCPLVLIKNAGVFLAAVIGLIRALRYLVMHRRFSWTLLALFLPFALLVSWNVYYAQHFTQGQRHQMSLAHYSQMVAEKSAADIKNVLQIILPRMLNFRENQVLSTLPGYVLVLLAILWQGKWKKQRHIFLLACVLSAIYEIGMLTMYLISMPMEDIIAQQGHDFVRYNSSITITLQGILLFLACHLDWTESKKTPLRCVGATAVSAICGIGIACLQWDQLYTIRPVQYRIDNYPAAYQASLIREELQALSKDGMYIVYFSEPEKTTGYNRSLTKYYLEGASVLRYYDEKEALAQRAKEPWRTYIDMKAGRIEQPIESVGEELFTRTSDAPFTNILDITGYKENTRYSTSKGEDVTAYHWDSTGHIPIRVGDVIRLQNITWQPTEENDGRGGICWYKVDEKFRNNIQAKKPKDLHEWNPVFDDAGNIIQITVPESVGTSTVSLRIICQDISSDAVITINEDIR